MVIFHFAPRAALETLPINDLPLLAPSAAARELPLLKNYLAKRHRREALLHRAPRVAEDACTRELRKHALVLRVGLHVELGTAGGRGRRERILVDEYAKEKVLARLVVRKGVVGRRNERPWPECALSPERDARGRGQRVLD